MQSWRRRAVFFLALVLLVAGCEAPSAPSLSSGSGTDQTTTRKRIIAAILGDPTTLSAKLNSSGPGNVPGVDALEDLVSAGFANTDDAGNLRPQLAEAIPTVENGLWKLLPEGRMETTWKIKPTAAWHDGVPFTSADVLFSADVGRSKEVALEYDAAYDSIEAVEGPDPLTVIVRWRRPFIYANTMFSRASSRIPPLPRHALERAFNEDKATFTDDPHWNTEWVGTGPFKLREWVRGSHLIVEASERYVLGKPTVDEIEVRFIQDPRTLAANILAGAVELTMGRGISLEQAVQIRDQWRDGKMDTRLRNWVLIYPQLLNPTPSVIGEVAFRRAALHAIDRQELADTFVAGLASVGHGYLSPEEPEYQDVVSSFVRYEYDARRATELIEGLGFRKGSDGGFRDSNGEKLSVELRTTGGDDLSEKAITSVADYWQRVGITVDAVVVPPQRARDREYRATFPSFDLRSGPTNAANLGRFSSTDAAVPENRFVGNNVPRYVNAEFDALVARYFVTIPRQERTEVLRQLVNHVSDRVVMMGLFYTVEPTLIANRVRNVTARTSGSSQAWNAERWDVN